MYPNHMANLDHNILNLQNRIESTYSQNAKSKNEQLFTSPNTHIIDIMKLNLTPFESTINKFNKKCDLSLHSRKFTNYHRESEIQVINQEEKIKIKKQTQSRIKELTENQSINHKEGKQLDSQDENQFRNKSKLSVTKFETLDKSIPKINDYFSTLDSNKRANSFIIPRNPKKLIANDRKSYYKGLQENALDKEIQKREKTLASKLENEKHCNDRFDSMSLTFVI